MKTARNITLALFALALGAWIVLGESGLKPQAPSSDPGASRVSGEGVAAASGPAGSEESAAGVAADGDSAPARFAGEVDSIGTSAAKTYAPGAEPEAAQGPLTIEQFEELTSAVNEALPTVDAIRAVGEAEAHGTPAAIREAGLELGRIARAVQENPALKQAAVSFYGNCAERADLPRSIRALCYSNFKSGAFEGLDDAGDAEDLDVPASVESLAQELE